jgi:hypothetical protein
MKQKVRIAPKNPLATLPDLARFSIEVDSYRRAFIASEAYARLETEVGASLVLVHGRGGAKRCLCPNSTRCGRIPLNSIVMSGEFALSRHVERRHSPPFTVQALSFAFQHVSPNGLA